MNVDIQFQNMFWQRTKNIYRYLLINSLFFIISYNRSKVNENNFACDGIVIIKKSILFVYYFALKTHVPGTTIGRCVIK